MTTSAPSMDLLGEAADWLVCFQSGEMTERERARFERWRASSPLHAAAWQRAEAVLGDFAALPPDTARQTLSRLKAPRRRQAMQVLGLMLAAAPASWLAWRELPSWTADLRTATGEQRTIELADGTRLVLNTASAVDVRYAAEARLLHLLAGEILVTNGRDQRHLPPLIVQSEHGAMRARDTPKLRFAVRLLARATRLSVFDGALAVTPARAATTVTATARAGQELEFTSGAVGEAHAVQPSAALWEKGMLVAKDMRLAALLDELARYRRGIVRCDPAIANLRVSGAFPVHDFERSLGLLRQTLGLQTSSVGPYWITVQRPPET
ncbi:FecR domain-containing protein [Janthinobacterium sp. J1-1]|uniref:FecR domain-containing protein n=1 Tax=Janthinobacterium sp. J1-1 TaxID=3065910 RepID=UPI00281117FD|nr:FecR domain-containing protein [Janthinobacterium sp. J1-1]